MSAHLIADPAVTASAMFPAAPGWLTLSAAMTSEAPVIADRDDLLVTIAPGAGRGAPACFLPAHAHIEVDGTHLGAIDPATATPHLIGDRARYAPTWGLLTHECAHAQHTRWTPDPTDPDALKGIDPGAFDAAKLLEEPRIEAAQIRRRPDDRHWLRASARTIILADSPATDPAHAAAMTDQDAATAAALLLARADGGILTPAEVAPVEHAVTTALGPGRLAQLRELWREALTVADDDTEAMLDLGRRWCAIIPPPPEPPATPDPAAGTGAEPGGSGTPSPLVEAIAAALDEIARTVADEEPPPDPAASAAADAAADTAATTAATEAARKVFGRGPGRRYGPTRTTGIREPTDAERRAARVLARALTTAGARDRVVTKSTSVLPPGRLRMRGVVAREAQRAAGAIPTAEPFTRTTRKPVPAPPLRLGIACDVSGSMTLLAGPVASAAWILAHAAAHTIIPADTATVIFGHHVRPITHPGKPPTAVTEFGTADNDEAIDEAIDALDGALGLTYPDAARLLIIVSDGRFQPDRARAGQKRIDRLRAAGCGVLWLTSHTCDLPLNGATVHLMTDPATTARAIGRAATAALRANR